VVGPPRDGDVLAIRAKAPTVPTGPAPAIERIPGATFIPWSLADPGQPYKIYLRNMLPTPAFAEAIQNVPANGNPASAATVMGPYYPRLGFCSLKILAASGPGACLAAN
jgi:hypothetical protein